jgi:hypothetical protein
MRPVKICNCRSLRCPRCGSTSKTPNPNCEGCRGRHCTTRWCIGNQCVDIYDPGCCDYGLACSWCRAISGYNDHTDRDCGGSYGAYIVQVPLTLDLDHVYCPQLCCKKYCSQSDELPLEAVQHSDYHDREDDGAESPQSNCATIGSGSRGRDRHDDSDDEINDNFDNGHEDDESSLARSAVMSSALSAASAAAVVTSENAHGVAPIAPVRDFSAANATEPFPGP